MIPQKLIIEGLYSYQKRQTIDFTDLTDSGLFGIFGATGSGKSSILEAISYALYGQTERLNTRDKRTYNMMNLKSNRSYIAFDFYNHENELFRAEREFKRNSKNFEDIRTPGVTFYKFKKDHWVPLEHSNAEKIIGLSYDNFKRTIIIPQGQFKEFLELGATERTRMMKDIFRLHRYDLQDKVSALNKQNKSELDKLEGRLKGYEAITGEDIEAKKMALKQANERLERAGKEHKVTDEKFQRLKHLKSDFEALKQKEKAFSELKQQREDVQKRQERTDDYERVYKAFYQLLKDLDRQKEKVQFKQKEREKTTKQLNKSEKHLKETKAQLEKITPWFEKLDQKKSEENDLKLIIKILASSEQIKQLKKDKADKEKILKKAYAREKEIQSDIDKAEKEIESLKPKKLDSKLLRQVGNWFTKAENLEEVYQKQAKKADDINNKIQSLLDELADKKINPETFESDISTEVKRLDEKREKLQIQKDDLNVRQKLLEHANGLHDGKPCPLCGAVEHPNIVEADDVSGELEQVCAALKDIEKQKKKIRAKKTETDKKLERKRLLSVNFETEQAQLKEIAENLKAHTSNFIWDGFDAEKPGEFREKQRKSEEIEDQIEDSNKRLKDLRKSKEKMHQNVEKCRESLKKRESQEIDKQAQIDSNRENLRFLNVGDYRQFSVEEVKASLENLECKNRAVRKQYETLTGEINDLIPKIASKNAELKAIKKRIAELNSDIAFSQKRVKEHLIGEEIDDIQTVKEILSREINVDEERKKIEAFNIEFETTKKGIEELEEKLSRDSFTEELFRQVKEKWEASKQILKGAEEAVTKRKQEVERLDKRFKEKQKLQKQHKKLEKRADNLNTMFRLFRGAGFVEYVSSIKLRQLCDHANVRFHRLTRNQLSLHLNENNDFEIIDYLNEGRSRSVKTLSGGQSFQVSLSLALALAESVQSNAAADKNFFFIDEGFGTQDAESINIIFETLLNLNKENKIVGIISHVEELKDRIPMSLMIKKDEEKGSLVVAN